LAGTLHDKPQEAIPVPHVDDRPHGVIRVLHVDDDTNQLIFTKRFLEELDPSIQVESVASPEEALSKASSFDCVVSDYVLPGMNGIELTHRVRETCTIPFILYTGQGSEEVAERAFAAGVDDYIRKELDPSHYQVLAKRIKIAVEKHQAENALIESERKYRSLVQNSRDGVMVFTGKELVYANQQAAVLHGCGSVEELMKISPSALLHPDDREYVEGRSLARQRGEDVPPITEFRLVQPDGTMRCVQSSSSLIQYDGKDSSLAFIRDITERKVYEEQLQSLHLHAAELSRIERPDEVFKITSEAMDKTLGFEVIDVIKIEDGMLRDVFVKGPGREPFMLSMTGVGVTVRAARTGEPQYVPDVTRDSDYVPGRAGGMMSEFAVPIMVENEAAAVLNVESHQIDAFTNRDRELLETLAFHMASAFTRLRKLSERREYEERLETLHRHATELGATENIEEVAEATTNAIERALGFRQGGFAIVEGNQLRFIQLIGVETSDPFDLSLDGSGITVRAVRTGTTQLVYDVREDKNFILGPGGRALGSLSELDVPLKVEGEVVGVINIESGRLDAFTLQDQQLVETLAIHVSSALSRLKRLDKLEKLVEEKTQEILDAERMVAAGRVASMVGHDLRGPLQTIRNAVYLLKRTPEKSEELLSIIKDAVQRSTEMLGEFRSRTRDTPLKIETTDLAALLNATVKEIQLPESVKMDLRAGDGLDAVSLDPLKIRRVLDNLVVNALDAMPDGGVLMMIVGKEEDEIVMIVSDTGVGIPEEEMPNLFKSFYTTKRKGLGLGLAYCKRAVEAHGGSITVKSKVGVGTTFTVELPTRPHAK